MSAPATADLIADLLLRHYREPMRYRGHAVREAHALGHLDVVLRLALGRSVELSAPALRAPGAAAELRRAAAFHIQQSFFRDGASHYEILGLAPDAPPASVRENFRLLMRLIHPDRHGADTEWPEGYAARANRAYSILKGAQTRAAYDRRQAAERARDAAARDPQSGRRATPSGTQTPNAAAGIRMPARAAPGRRPVQTAGLPDWLTAGVGGFVLRHPEVTLFGAVIAASALFIGAAIWPEHDNALNAESAYTVAEPAQRAAPDRARGTELPAAERTASAEPRVTEPPPLSLPHPLPTPTTVRARTEPPAARAVAGPARVADMPPSLRPGALSVAAPARVADMPPSLRPGALSVAASSPPPVPAPAVSVPPPTAAPVPSSPVQSAAERQTASPPATPVSGATTGVPAQPERIVVAALPPPGSAEVETLIATFVSSYESGRLSVFGGLFHDDAQANQQRGRAAIVSEYDQLFRSTTSRRMTISQLRWQVVGDHAEAKGELAVKTLWRDGREAEQRVAVDMDIVRQGGRTVISRLGLQPR